MHVPDGAYMYFSFGQLLFMHDLKSSSRIGTDRFGPVPHAAANVELVGTNAAQMIVPRMVQDSSHGPCGG